MLLNYVLAHAYKIEIYLRFVEISFFLTFKIPKKLTHQGYRNFHFFVSFASEETSFVKKNSFLQFREMAACQFFSLSIRHSASACPIMIKFVQRIQNGQNDSERLCRRRRCR